MKLNIIGESIFKVTILAALAVVIFLQFKRNDNIAYVDAIKLVGGYSGMAQARKEFELKTSVWKANIDTLKNELESKVSEYEKNKSTLSARERKLNEELLQTKIAQFEQYQATISEKIQKEDQEISSKVLGQVNEYIKTYGQRNGYRIIMAATQYGNIVYGDEAVDLTDEILEGLNNGSAR